MAKYPKIECRYCGEHFASTVIKRHEDNGCLRNPKVLKIKTRKCAVCKKNFVLTKNNRKDQKTCSYACSNKHFRSGENANNRKSATYRTQCFLYHDRKCIVCGERNIVTVHHLDENNKNDDPRNLVPLCPTHHQYVHSRYRKLVMKKINEYVKEFRSRYKYIRFQKRYKKAA